MIQLNPSIPVITPRGSGEAVGWIDYSPEHDLMWIVFLDDNCECWIFQNKDIRAHKNFTLGRTADGKRSQVQSVDKRNKRAR